MSESILEEAQRLTAQDRQGSYGHPLDDFTKTAAMWTALLSGKLKDGVTITPEEVGLFMVCVKLSREAHQHKRDNLVDGAGYMSTVNMIIEEKDRRNAIR